ncbi:hypothetical protein [Pontimicrobium sp. MEBiC01747]
MKKLIVLLITILLGHLSYSQSKSYKQEQIESFQSEMKKINDSSSHYFDLGIKLFKEGKDAIEIKELIKPKLIYFQAKIDKKARAFQKVAEKLKLTNKEYDSIFIKLNENFKLNLEKYKYLSENGINID